MNYVFSDDLQMIEDSANDGFGLDADEVLQLLARLRPVLAAAEKVARRCSSHRNAKCVMELKKAVEALVAQGG